MARLSARTSSSGSSVTPSNEDKSGARTDLKALAEMVNRGRRRTRFTSRTASTSTDGTVSHLASQSADGLTKVHYLPRGGVHVATKYGAVQFGLPPETIKFATLGWRCRYLRRAKDRFNLKYGRTPVESRLPNFFIKGWVRRSLHARGEYIIARDRRDVEGSAEEYSAR